MSRWSRLKSSLYTPKGVFYTPKGLLKGILYLIPHAVHLVGCRVVGNCSNGNVLLKVNKTNALGKKGALLQVPPDKVIFQAIRYFGSWELDECRFLGEGLARASREYGIGTTMLDIGANVGLITLQSINLSEVTNCRLIMLEPLPGHIDAIRQNVSLLATENEVEVCHFALADQDAEAFIYTQSSNHGNSSLVKSAVPGNERSRTTIRIRNTEEFAREYLHQSEHYVIKCDTQGRDAMISSRLPKRIWDETMTALIEIWAINEIEETDVVNCIELWKTFDRVSWSSHGKDRVSLSAVAEFWLSKSGEVRNLFLGRTLQDDSDSLLSHC